MSLLCRFAAAAVVSAWLGGVASAADTPREPSARGGAAIKAVAVKSRAHHVDVTGVYEDGMSAYGIAARMAASGRLDKALQRVRQQRIDRPSAKSTAPFNGRDDGTLLPGGQSDMSVAVDATGNNVVVLFNDGQGYVLSPVSVTGYAYSSDAGVHFTDGGSLPSAQQGTFSGASYPQVHGDPDVKYVPGGAGCQFIAVSVGVIGINGTGTAPNIAYGGTAQTLVLHRSVDCGHTWAGPFEVTPATNPTGVILGGSARDAADRPAIDVDPDTGRIIVAWSSFTSTGVLGGGAEVRTTLSDNVISATPPTWSASALLNGGASDFDTGATPRFAGRGSTHAYVAWARKSNAAAGATPYGGDTCGNTMFARSTDNGLTWSTPARLHSGGVCAGGDYWPMDEVPGNDRINGFPSIAVDTSAGAAAGNVYVTYAANDAKDGGDVYLVRSIDGGVSFSSPIRVNSAPGADRAQWFPYVTVASTGRVYLVWYDQQNGAGDLTETMMTYSEDAAATWTPPIALSARPFHAGYGNDASQPNLGERIGATTSGDMVYAAWAGTPVTVGFADGQPASASFGAPMLLFKRANASHHPVRLGAIVAREYSQKYSNGNGALDPGEWVEVWVPLVNYVTNPLSGPKYLGGYADIVSSAPGFREFRKAVYSVLGPGDESLSDNTFLIQLPGNMVPGTKLELSLVLSDGFDPMVLPFTLDTGLRHPSVLLSESFESTPVGSLPPGWTSEHLGGTNTVPWRVATSPCTSSARDLFHPNANDAADPTRTERVLSPPFAIPSAPAGAPQSVRLYLQLCYELEDDPDFTVRAYDGFTIQLLDVTSGRIVRTVHPEAFAETIQTAPSGVPGDPFDPRGPFHYPKHLPRNANAAYLQDAAVWSGSSAGTKVVQMELPGMEGSTVQLAFDFTQDAQGICTDAGHTGFATGGCGVAIQRVEVQSASYDAAVAEVAITASPIPPIVDAGQNITYGFDVRAAASNAFMAANVTFRNALPAGAQFVAISRPPGEWDCTTPAVGAEGTISCFLLGLVAGQVAHFDIVANAGPHARDGASCNSTATITTESPQNTSDDTATAGPCVFANARANLAALLIAPATATAGMDATYRLGVFDYGPSDAMSVSLSFSTPPGTTFVAEQQLQGPSFACTVPAVGASGIVLCTAPVLALNQGATFDVKVHFVDAGDTVSSVTVASTTAEQAPIDNTATGLTHVTAALLDVTVAGGGAGRVTSLPKGIDCPTSCVSSFAAGALVSLNAAASPGARFTGWSGACTGTGRCLITMDAVHSVTATFVTGGPTFELTLARQGSGTGGSVDSVPSGIACGVACAASYAAGDVVMLTATGGERAAFVGWTGACSGSGACTVTMSAAQDVGADFALVPALLERTDLDADGRADLVFRHGATGDTFLSQMNGLQIVAQARMDVTSDWTVVHTGDFDGDGKSDLVWRNDVTHQTAIWLMTGTQYATGQVILTDPAWHVTLVGDFDGDGRSDLVWRNDAAGETAIWLMNGTARKAGAIVMSDAQWRATQVADFDGDGKSDLVWRNDATGATAIWMMNGASFTAGGVVMTNPLWSVTATGDFDGDGKSDLVWRNHATGETAIWLMNGAAYGSGAIVLVNHLWAVTHAPDLDGDGRSDLVWRNGATGEAALWLMQGLVRGPTARLADTQDYELLRTADFNGDGKADLVWRNRVTGETKLELMSGVTRLDYSPFSIQPVEWVVQ